MPLVVLEGPDGSGKSTLAQKLLKGTGRPTILVKRSVPPGDIETIDRMTQWLLHQSAIGMNVIADRHPIISEYIYRPVVRQEGPPPWTMDEVVSAFRGRAILLIYCRPPVAWLEEGVQKEEQMGGVHEHFGALVLAYASFFMHLGDAGIPFHFYNYQNDPDASNAIRLVKEFWDHRRV
jgi:hypothetical protein